MKKLISVLLCIIIMMTMSVIAFAEEENAVTDNLSAKSAILMEISSGQVLLSKNPEKGVKYGYWWFRKWSRFAF